MLNKLGLQEYYLIDKVDAGKDSVIKLFYLKFLSCKQIRS